MGKIIKTFDELNEDASATLGNTGGMGAVVAPIASSTPGDVAGSTPGSGDSAAVSAGGSFEKPVWKQAGKTKKMKKRKVSNFGDWINNKK